MKQCKNYEKCKNTIADQYIYCKDCVDNYNEGKKELVKETDSPQQIVDLIEKCNWNLGSIALTLKLQLLSQLENKETLTEIQEKIHSSLLDKSGKDLKALKQIKEEQEKDET